MPKNDVNVQTSDHNPRDDSKQIPNDRVVAISEDSAVIPRLSLYEEQQNEEIEVLKSVFPDEYEEVKTKSAWSRNMQKSFKLSLSAYSNPEFWIVLLVTLRATYPKTLPELSLGETHHLRRDAIAALQHIISVKPKELHGDVMVYELASMIRDELENFADVEKLKKQLPSLEVERAQQEEMTISLARNRDREESSRIEHERLAQALEQEALVEAELKRRQGALKNQRSIAEGEEITIPLPLAFESLMFEEDIAATDDLQNRIAFRGAQVTGFLARGVLSDILKAVPILPHSPSRKNPVLLDLVIKRTVLDNCAAKQLVVNLERDLEILKGLRHPNVNSVLDFRIQQDHEGAFQLDVLTEFASKGSLLRKLQKSNTLSLAKARYYMNGIIKALEFYHRNGIYHGRVNASNVLLSETSSETVVRLSDGSFQQSLHELQIMSNNRRKSFAIQTSWHCPDLSNTDVLSKKNFKSDIWELGVVLLQMLFGMNVTEKHKSPQALLASQDFTESFETLVRDLFNPKKRPRASEIVSCEFLRGNDSVIGSAYTDVSRISSSTRLTNSTALTTQYPKGDTSGIVGSTSSRYSNEWTEIRRLGRGGYGAVFKAEFKYDKGLYAIKKIPNKTPSELTQVFFEVRMLATLNHPYIVRYHTAWPEDELSANVSSTDSTTDSLSTTGDVRFGHSHSTFGLGPSSGPLADFISSSGYPKIEFGEDDGSGSEEDESSEENSSSRSNIDSSQNLVSHQLQRQRSYSRATIRSTLYIQMEFCEKFTLRDVIRKGIYDKLDDGWRLFRQILEGMAHIHGHGIIHRDLKPENIFIDNADNPKIGDFGLATTSQYLFASTQSSNSALSDEMTRSVGTAMYVAPELSSTATGQYTDKVDMYSLGIIFFELCHPLKTAMERGQILQSLRQKEHTLPLEFQSSDKQAQGEIIKALINHRPSERPSSNELLRSGKIPFKIDEQMELVLQKMSEANSPYFHKMMSGFFSESSNPTRAVREQIWDMSHATAQARDGESHYVLLQSLIESRLASIFRRHGAIRTSRQEVIPFSKFYIGKSAARLLHDSGTLVQLPYDLILPHARQIAKQGPISDKSFCFGSVFREDVNGGSPTVIREADFDIVSYDSKDLAMKEAEVVKVLDEVLDAIPSLSKTPMCFHIAHASLLDLIFEYCRISEAQRNAAAEVLANLHIQSWTWQKIRFELRAPSIGIASTSLDDLARFDFRDTPEKCFIRLQQIFAGSEYLIRMQSIFTHISGLAEYIKRLGVKRNVYCSPLSTFNYSFYRAGVMFQCIYDTKRRAVLAAGGRYDSLIEEHRLPSSTTTSRSRIHAVGTNIAWDRLVASMAKYHKQPGSGFLKKGEDVEIAGLWASRRCDVLVASFDATTLRTIGFDIVCELWQHNISAEIAIDTRSPEELLAHYRDDKHSWIIIIKQEQSGLGKPDLRIKSIDKGEDTDIRSQDLISHFRAEIRDRDQRESTNDRAKFLRHPSHTEPATSTNKPEVRVLTANHKSKKQNKWRVVEAAHAKVAEVNKSHAGAPIASIETRDEIMDLIQETRMSDPDSWRRVEQSVPLADREYVQQIHRTIQNLKWQYGDMSRNCWIYNFKSGTCIYYDMRL